MGISEQQYRAHMERRRLGQCAPAFGSVAAPVVTDDPYERGAKLTVLRSLRDDPLAAMHNARQIDQAQFVAGRHWQRAFELAEVGGCAPSIPPGSGWTTAGSRKRRSRMRRSGLSPISSVRWPRSGWKAKA